MSLKNFIGGVITYGLVFMAGYYLGGGCRDISVESNKYARKTPPEIEKRLEDYGERIENLEDKVKEIWMRSRK